MKLNHRFLLRKGDLSIGVSGTVAANSPTSARVTAVVAYDLNPLIGLQSAFRTRGRRNLPGIDLVWRAVLRVNLWEHLATPSCGSRTEIKVMCSMGHRPTLKCSIE